MFIELMNSEIKEREIQLRQMFEKKVYKGTRTHTGYSIREKETHAFIRD